jgi:hypothetical protein
MINNDYHPDDKLDNDADHGHWGTQLAGTYSSFVNSKMRQDPPKPIKPDPKPEPKPVNDGYDPHSWKSY